ncbi:OPA3-like protein [Tanacetum coccineum]
MSILVIPWYPGTQQYPIPPERVGALYTLLSFMLALKNLSHFVEEENGHPTLRCLTSFLLANHRLTTNIQRRIYGHATDVEIRPLNEEKAVQAAGDLISELFVFSVAGVALVFEWQRNSRSEAKKEEARRQEFEVMRQRDEDLAKEVESLKQKLQELEQLAKGKGLAGID